jgi:hypothetical protein
MTIQFKPTASSRLYWAGRPAMRVVQALRWLKDTLPDDHDRIVTRLRKVIADPSRGGAIRDDLVSGFSTLPTWMQPIIRDVLGTTGSVRRPRGRARKDGVRQQRRSAPTR